MITEIMVLKDVKTGAFQRPVFVPTLGALVRELQDAMFAPGAQDMLALHPEDFVLYRLGTFDDQAGVIVSLRTPEFVLDIGSLRVAQVRPAGPAAPLAAVN